MQTKETILEIVSYCKEHNITYKDRCAEAGVPLWDFYESKRRYKSEDSRPGAATGEFIQLRPDGPMVPSNLLAIEGETKSGPRQRHGSAEPTVISGMLSLELRTASGNVLRLYGQMTAAMVPTLLASGPRTAASVNIPTTGKSPGQSSSISGSVATMPTWSFLKRKTYPWRNAAAESTPSPLLRTKQARKQLPYPST